MSQAVMNELVDMSQEIIRLKDQRRELLRVLEEIADYARKDGDLIAQHLGGIARAAISKAEGITA